MNLVFAGTPDFASAFLHALVDEPTHQVVGVYTQPDRPAGRGKQLRPSPVKAMAQSHGLPVFQPASLKDQSAQTELAALQPDLMIVVAYGLMLPEAVLGMPRHGCINVHASLLPRWRGAAPVQRAIAAGDRKTGVTIMRMDASLDTGDMLAHQVVAIDPTDTSGLLFEKLLWVGPPLLLQTLQQVPGIFAGAQSQDEALATYAPKITSHEAQLDWSRPARELNRWIRALNPQPGAYTLLGDERIKVWRACAIAGEGRPGEILECSDRGIVVACGRDALQISDIQLAGRKPAAVVDVLRGNTNRFIPGDCFASGQSG